VFDNLQARTFREYQSITAAKVRKFMCQADVRDVGTPDLVGPRHEHASEKVRIGRRTIYY